MWRGGRPTLGGIETGKGRFGGKQGGPVTTPPRKSVTKNSRQLTENRARKPLSYLLNRAVCGSGLEMPDEKGGGKPTEGTASHTAKQKHAEKKSGILDSEIGIKGTRRSE